MEVDSDIKPDGYAASSFLKCLVLLTDVELLAINPREASNEKQNFQSLCTGSVKNEL